MYPEVKNQPLISKSVTEQIKQEWDADYDIFKHLGQPYQESSFHGYVCADFMLDGRECKVVKPKKAAVGHPWIWRARFWGHEPQTDIALLEHGYHLVHYDQSERMGSPECVAAWDKFYALLRKAGLGPKVVLEGMSRGAVYVFNWAAANPDNVAAVYVDNPLLDCKAMFTGPNGEEKPDNEVSLGLMESYGMTREQMKNFRESPIDKVDKIVEGNYPILILCAELDEAAINSQNTYPFEKKVKTLGGKITVIEKKGFKHHPHSFPDPTPIVDFILNASREEEKKNYAFPFNPMQGLVNKEEREWRQDLCLNGRWEFMPVYEAKASDFVLPSTFRWEPVPIKIPSPWNVNAYTNGTGGDFLTYPSYPDQWKEAKIGWMKKTFSIPADWTGKELILHFESVMGKALVYVNGQKVTENFELFLPFEANVTEYLKPGQSNEILVGVAKASLFDDRGKYGRRTYVGGSMWGIEMAGIWQDVYLFAYPSVYVQDVFIQPDVANRKLRIELNIDNRTDQKRTVDIEGEVKKWYNMAGRSVHEAPVQKGELASATSLAFQPLRKVVLSPHSVTKVVIEKEVANELEYWTPETPNLYGLLLSLKSGKQTIDKKQERFGWRQFSISGNKLLLNSTPIQLKGDSWHFMGVPQMTRRYAWAWFNMLKEVNANAVRFHAQPFPRFYLDMADEMGICVLDETGIWSSDGGPKIDSEDYWENCVEHLRRLIKRDKNHASVFGWSVCNETVPVAVHVFKAPEELVERQLKEINRWVATTAEMDPTRPWISGDGETDRPTDLPIVIGHYGGDEGMKKWAAEGKPWGIGEQSMAYYGTPKQAAAYNGDRAYESMLGRMEAVAIESYDLIKTQREYDASYSSIFNLVWYALQPLELGQKDTRRKSVPTDGIFFGFEEGRYGMQPERLGPYTTTLNPGYDLSLPLFRTWPLFDAVKAANTTPIQPYNGKIAAMKNISPANPTPIESVYLFAGDNSSLKDELENLGIRIEGNRKKAGKKLLIIDGKEPSRDEKQWTVIQQMIGEGASVLVWGISPESLLYLNKILPYPVDLEERQANSFLVQQNAPLLEGLGHNDFYFSELLRRGGNVMQYGLTGYFVSQAKVQLRACNTNWQHWNYQAEISKTGYVFRSEQEAKGSDIVLASLSLGKNEFIISTLDLKEIRQETQPLMTQIFTNLGVQISEENLSSLQALDAQSVLKRALICGPVFAPTSQSVSEMLSNAYIDQEENLVPTLHSQSEGKNWQVLMSNNDGTFEISNIGSSDGQRNPVVYLSFWIFSPRSLSDLLIEPNMPSLDMYLDAAGGFTLWTNGKKVESKEIGEKKEIIIPNLLLEKGWNHIKIKLVRGEQGGNIKGSVRFHSADEKFMKQVISSVVR